MSYFYLKPTHGTVSLHLLEECVFQRWNYFQNDTGNLSVNFCQYICEDSAYDNIGHFMLSLLSGLSGDKNLIDAVFKGEEDLFMCRINSAKTNDLRLLSKTILKILANSKQGKRTYLNALSVLCKNLLIKHVAEHLTSVEHTDVCKMYHISVHFSLCFPLVAKRLVDIDSGVAKISCGAWKYFLRLLFRSHLNSRCYSAAENKANIDPRWKEIILKLRQDITFKNKSSHVKMMSYRDIDKQSALFPPCMQNLHSTLRSKHRLTHNERFRYSLFLKDIGLPVQQAIYFWQEEYSKPCDDKSTCSHTWLKDGNKYIYGIRHLYGLEGSRKNYCMSSCQTVQSRSSAEGGCPFKHFDSDLLKNMIIPDINEQTWEQILLKKNTGKNSDACSIYKSFLISTTTKKNQLHNSHNKILSPVRYYEEMNSK